MKKLLLIFFLFGFLFLSNCSKNEKVEIVKIEEDQIEGQMIKAYQEGMVAFKDQFYLEAAKKFNEAEILFPQSNYAPKAALMAAYSYYSQNYYGDSVAELERFLRIYPNHYNISYAEYLLGLCFYEDTNLSHNHMSGTSQKFNNYVFANKPMIVNNNNDFSQFKKSFDIFDTVSPNDPKKIALQINFLLNNKTRYYKIKENFH